MGASASFDKKLDPLQFSSLPGLSNCEERADEESQASAPWRLPVTNITFGSVLTASDARTLIFNLGRSTYLPSKPPSFYTIEISSLIDELVNALEHPRIHDGFDLFSRQSLVGQDALSKVRQPERLRHLVWTNLLTNIGMWSASAGELCKAFSDDVHGVANIVRPGAQPVPQG
ncbi:hypothetical protein EV421DRAFT_1335396 [Armillaria borealis]|uniref:Uncharacterized protein n=1 Tax=Armillaria borealis TaxID=47425 RepID=A0AA39J1J3_9AGAR|nr:hypothetical protein EV421DRAFT_1335396 [Armillaria borealis]